MMQRKGHFAAEKTHFKLYKAKKNWLVAGITLIGFGLVGGVSQVNTVKAATVASVSTTNVTDSSAANETSAATNSVSEASSAADLSAQPAANSAGQLADASAATPAPSAATAASTAAVNSAVPAASSTTSSAAGTASSQSAAALSTPAAASSVASLAAKPQVAGGVQVKTQVSPVNSAGSLTEASAATPLTADNLLSPRNIVVTVAAKAGDAITVDVPWLFSAVSDQVMGVQQTQIPATKTDQTQTTRALKDTLFTYQATTDSIQTFNVTLTAQNIMGGLNDQATFPVILSVNGAEQARLTYTVSHAVGASFNSVALDHNQTGTLVTDQNYVYGVKLSHGVATRWTGNLSVAVPAGFILTGGATKNSNSNYNTALGDSATIGSAGTTQDKMAQITQPGGAGTPLLISAIGHYLSYDGYSFYFWGQYQTPVTQADNTFTVTGALTATTDDGGYQLSTSSAISGSTNIPTAVTDNPADQKIEVQKINLITGGELFNNQGQADSDHVYLDLTEANGTKQSDDTAYSYTVAQRAAVILNTGNVAQTNATLVVNVPAGTEAIKSGVNRYYYAFDTDVYNPLTSIVLTLANGQQQTYTDADLTSSHRLILPAGDDGTQVVQIAATWAQVLAGKEVGIAYMNNAMTAGQIGDTITQNMTYTSDQITTPLTATRTLTMVAAPTMPLVTEVMPYFVNLSNVYRPGNTFDMQFLIKTSRAAHLGTYYVTVPQEFDVNTINWFGVSGLENINDDVTDLGYIGANGEHVLKVDLSGITSSSFISNQSTGADMRAGFVLNVSVNDDALPLTKPINWNQIVQIVNADDYTRTNQQATLTDTIYGAETATVMAPQVTEQDQWTYQIVLPANLTAMDGIDDPATDKVAYVAYNAEQADTTTAHFDKGATATAVDDLADSQIRLVTYNGTDQPTAWTQNLVVLPRTTDGAAFDLVLTAAGKITAQSVANDAELLYSTQVVTAAANTQIDQSSFVPASAVTDWASVRSILLTTGELVNADVIQAYLPVTVPDIENAPIDQDNLFNATFATAKSDGGVYQLQQQLNAQVLESTTVTTHWVTQAADGTQTEIQPAQVDRYQTGAAYTTAALAAKAVPAGYRLLATPTNAEGTTVRAGVTVTYVYGLDNQTVTVHYIDVSDSEKTADWTALDGPEITAAIQTLTGPSATAYENQLVIPTGYRLAAPDAYDAGAVAGTYDTDATAAQTYKVYVVQDQQTATVTYVDQNTQQTLHTDTLTGVSNGTQDYSQTRADIQGGFEQAGYVYVSEKGDALAANNLVTFDSDATTDQSTTIYLKHDVLPVTPDQPQTPGDEIPNNPNSWPKGTADLDLSKTVTETVQYVYSDGGKVAVDQHQSVTFQRVAIVDKVTGDLLGYLAPNDLTAYQADSASVTLSDNAWTAVNGDTFVSLTSPAGKAGYTADLATTEAYQVTPTTGDLALTVTYQADTQKATVTYADLDANNAVLKTDALNGVSNGTQDYSKVRAAIQSGFEELGYVYVRKDGDALDANNVVNFDSDNATDQNTTIYLKHSVIPVTPDQPQTPDHNIPNTDTPWPNGTGSLDLNKTVTETVQYVYSDGGKATADQHQSVTFQRVAIVDKITGALLGYLAPNDLATYQADSTSIALSDNAWTAVNGDTFVSLESPVGKAGYTADLAATKSYQVTPTTGNLMLTVTYQADGQKATVTYVDLDANNTVLKTDILTGVSNGTQDYSKVRNAIQSGFEKLGYVYVREDGDALDANNVVNFDDDTTIDQNTTIYLKHSTIPVTPDQPQTPDHNIPNTDTPWPEGTADLDLNKTVTETVQYVYSDGGKVATDQHQSVTFQRVAIVDRVTGTLLGYVSPNDLAAYQADSASIALSDDAWTAVNGDTFVSLISPAGKAGYTADLTATDNYTVTPTTGDLALTVTYQADEQKATVTYVDLDANNAVLKTDKLTGVSNGTQNYSKVRNAIQSGFEELGYVYVREDGDALDTNNVVNFDSDTATDQNTTIYLKHSTIPVTPDQPQTPENNIPNTPNPWPEGTSDLDLNKTITETVQYVYSDGGKVATDQHQSVTFQRVAIVDKITGALLGYVSPNDLAAYQADSASIALSGDAWTAVNGDTFVSLTSPAGKAGYTADLIATDNYTVTPTTGDLVLTVTYQADEQKATVTYVDLDANNIVLKTDTLKGVSNGVQDYSKVRNAIQSGFEKLGYIYVNEDGDALDANNVVNFDSDVTQNQNTTIYLKHDVIPVTPDQPQTPDHNIPNTDTPWPNGTGNLDLNKTVTETVQYVYSDGGKVTADQHQSVTFQRVAIVDKITGELLGYLAPNDLTAYQADSTSVTLSDNAWTAVNGDTFVSLTSPAGKAGYTADLIVTDNYTVTPTTGDLVLTVTYQADEQKAMVTYVDLDANNIVLKTDTLNGVSNGTQDYSKVRNAIQSGFEKLGYVYVREDGDALDANNVVNFDSDVTQDQNTTIYLKHSTIPVTPDQPQTPGNEIPNNPNNWPNGVAPQDLKRTVTERIQYVYTTGGKVAPDYHTQVTFQRVAIVDQVTGALLGYLVPSDLADYQADPTQVVLTTAGWTPTATTFAAVTSPKQTGYHADLQQVDTYSVTPNTGNLALVVTYTSDLPDTDEPGMPTNPDTPDNPGTPTDPDTPDNPGTPTNPDTPDNPGTPTNPDVPNNPGTPTNPDTPDNPSTPTNPDTPDNPSTPTNPDTPDNPGTPTNPDTPDNPGTQTDSDTPDNPGTPTDPDTPDNPGTPTDPDTPDNPDTPTDPDTPDNPGTPTNLDNPDTPTDPDTPGNPDTNNPGTPVNPDVPDNPSTPTNPDTPAPTVPSAPVVPGASNSETPDQPSKPIETTKIPDQAVTPTQTTTTPSNQLTAQQSQSLPQTGAQDEALLTALGLTVLGTVGLLGAAKLRKRQDGTYKL